MPQPRILYGVMLKDVLANSDPDEMRAFLLVSSKMLAEAGDDFDGPEAEEWRAAHEELARAIAE